MDIFAQKKFLLSMVAVLTVLNIVCIGVFLWKDFSHRPPPPPPHHFRDVAGILKRELQLSDEQSMKIDMLRSDFFEREKVVLSILRSQRDSMNMEMFNKNTNHEVVQALARRVADNEYAMEMLRYEQAQQLKSVCTPEQLEKFEELVLEIRDYFRPDNQPPMPR